jgi:hypothetical protein
METASARLMQHGLFADITEVPFGGPAEIPVREAPDGSLTQVAPGKWAASAKGEDPEHIIAEVFRHADGTLGFRPSGYGRMAKICSATGALLGFQGQLETIRRLGRAGFVRLCHPSPSVYLLDLDSWFAHLDQTEEDPDLWDAGGANLRRYLMANGLRAE